MYFNEIGLDVDCIHLAQDKDQWWAVAYKAGTMKFKVAYKAGTFLTS
jgi:hypothetical protein